MKFMTFVWLYFSIFVSVLCLSALHEVIINIACPFNKNKLITILYYCTELLLLVLVIPGILGQTDSDQTHHMMLLSFNTM